MTAVIAHGGGLPPVEHMIEFVDTDGNVDSNVWCCDFDQVKKCLIEHSPEHAQRILLSHSADDLNQRDFMRSAAPSGLIATVWDERSYQTMRG